MKKFAKNLIKTCFYIFLVLMFLLLLLFCLFQFGLLDNFVAVRFDPDKLVFSTSQVYMTDYNNNEIDSCYAVKYVSKADTTLNMAWLLNMFPSKTDSVIVYNIDKYKK